MEWEKSKLGRIMKYLNEFISYLPVIAIKGLGAWIVIGFILNLFGLDILDGTSGYTHLHYYIIAILAVGSAIHFFQKYFKK